MSSDYDDFAVAYAAANETNLLNAHYERPEMLRLAGDVRGRRILDAGCGAGPLAAALRDRGADVAGFDSSAVMVELARQRLGPDADLELADIGEPLPYPDATFDDVVASLVLHYLRDWVPPLRELRRVLKPGGRLILSVHHPLAFPLGGGGSYFPVVEWPLELEFGGQRVTMATWHHPLHAQVEAFAEAGFRIVSISEPPVADDTPEELLIEDGRPLPRRFVSFIFYVLESPGVEA